MPVKVEGMLMYRIPLCTLENIIFFPIYMDERGILVQNAFSFMQCSPFTFCMFCKFLKIRNVNVSQ